MKKILFLLLLLCTVSIYGQTTTGQEQEFDYGIKNNSTQTITTPPYLTTTGMDGTQGKIPSALIEKTDNKQDNLTDGGTGTFRYPTVNAVSAGLATKATLSTSLQDRIIKFNPLGELVYTNLISDASQNFTKFKVENPIAPTVTDSGLAGILNGTYFYSVSFYNSVGETLASNSAGAISVVNKQIQISNIPISLDSTVLGRRIYRSAVNANEAVDGKKLLVDIANNTDSTYLDNVPDGSLGVVLKWNNTTSGVYQQNGVTIFDTDLNNLQIGFGAKSNGYANTAVGSQALAANTTGKRNSAFSLYALYSNATGDENTAGGVHSLNYNSGGSYNTAWGYASLFYNQGNNNTGVGNRAFEANVSGSGNVGIGFQAGDKELGSNKFYVDNQSRSTEANGRTKALVYGEFNSNETLQTFRVNGQFSSINVSGTNTGDQLITGVTDIHSISGATFFASGVYPLNSPTGEDTFVEGIQFPVEGSNNSYKQILASNSANLYFKSQVSGIWGGWSKIYSSANSNLPYVDWTANNLTAANYTGSATLTGTPTAPTAAPGTTGNQIATLDYVLANSAVRPYKVYTALYSQNSTSDPTVVILENTLGTVTFTRSSNGVYLVNSSGLFTAGKTFVIMGAGTNAAYTNAINLINSSTFSIVTKVSSTQSDADSANTKVAFEIRVYN